MDFWVDGHYIFANSAEDALAEAEWAYDFKPTVVRPWTDEDQAELDRQNA